MNTGLYMRSYIEIKQGIVLDTMPDFAHYIQIKFHKAVGAVVIL